MRLDREASEGGSEETRGRGASLRCYDEQREARMQTLGGIPGWIRRGALTATFFSRHRAWIASTPDAVLRKPRLPASIGHS